MSVLVTEAVSISVPVLTMPGSPLPLLSSFKAGCKGDALGLLEGLTSFDKFEELLLAVSCFDG